MFDLTRTNIDQGYGRCRLSGHFGVYCGDHCAIFTGCELRINEKKKEKVVNKIKITTPNDIILKVPISDEDLRELCNECYDK